MKVDSPEGSNLIVLGVKVDGLKQRKKTVLTEMNDSVIQKKVLGAQNDRFG